MANFNPIATARSAAMAGTAQWTAADVARIGQSPQTTIAMIGAGDIRPVVPGLDFWDMWPIATRDGATARFDGREVWMALSAPSLTDPGARHDIARIRLLVRDGDDYLIAAMRSRTAFQPAAANGRAAPSSPRTAVR